MMMLMSDISVHLGILLNTTMTTMTQQTNFHCDDGGDDHSDCCGIYPRRRQVSDYDFVEPCSREQADDKNVLICNGHD